MSKTITWIDVETTGLNPNDGSLLEVACLVTDGDLNILDADGYQAVIRYNRREMHLAMGEASEYVYDMHTKTGLWGKLESGTPLSVVNAELAEYVARFSDPRTSPVGGNSVRLDMNFMDAYLPAVAAHLDYHMVDVSTVSGLANLWYGAPWFEKASDHTAMTDIRESIKELQHFRKTVFVK